MIKIGLTDFTPENKLINIRDKNQVIKAKYAIGKDDILKYSLMDEHYIEISFELNRNVLFKRSDYIEWQGEKYTLRNDYQTEQVNKRKYKYTLKFEALEMFFQDIQYYYLNQGLKESEWRLTGNSSYFIQIVVDNVNRYFGSTDFMLGTIEPTEIKDIVFDVNTNTFDALTQIADVYSAEWHITGKTIHLLNKVSFGDEVAFETEVSVLSMKREEGESNTPYTRILALGSTRNIPYEYRTSSVGEAVDAIYTKRLRIPANKGSYIDAYPNMSPDEVVEGTVIFDEVYPKRVGTIEAIGTIEYKDTNEDTGEVTKWNAYTFKDSEIYFKEEYMLPEQDLKLQFTSGDLNGRDFVLKFHPKDFSSSDNSQYFEIYRTDDYGKQLPNDIMKPKVGDNYVLYGFNIALVSDQYVPAAEQELYDVASTWQQKQLRDTGVYECPTVIGYFKQHQMDLVIGQKVKLVFDDEFKTQRSSRIMGFEKKLNNKFDAIYTVGDNSSYSRLGKIEQQIKELQVAGVVYESTVGSGVYVIKQFDSTRPTDFNVYSSKATNAKYFNKQTGDTVVGNSLFEQNLQVQGTLIGDVFQNSSFTAGAFGSGFQLKRDSNGSSYAELDYLTVRKEMLVNELTIAKIKSVGGSILLSLAAIKTIQVEDKGTYWRCYFNNDKGNITNDFQVKDQAICQTFTGKNIKRYWSLVVGVGTDYIDLSKTDKDGTGIPAVGDELIQLGNRTDVNRQAAILLSAYGGNAPAMYQYAQINSFSTQGKEVTAISPNGNQFIGDFKIATNGTTAPIYKDLGLFVNGRTYYLNDRVSHLGSYWVCIVNSTIQTPNETSSVWRKDTAGKTDIDTASNLLRTEYKADFSVLKNEVSSKVSQSDFNALGTRVSTAESTIKQTPDQIKLEVSKIQIGGRNLVQASDVYITTASRAFTFSDYKELSGKTITISVDIEVENVTGTRIGFEPAFQYADGTAQYIGAWHYPTKGTNFKGRISTTATLSDKAITGMTQRHMYVFCTGTVTKIGRPKLEIGNKATDWSPAPEDTDAAINLVRSDYTADFSVLKNEVSSKVAQTDFNALGNRVTTAESTIKQTPDQIKLEVSKIQIGGRNLVQGTGTFTTGDILPNYSSWGTIQTDKFRGNTIMKISSAWCGFRLANFPDNKLASECTLSFYARVDSGSTTFTSITQTGFSIEVNSTQWKQYAIVLPVGTIVNNAARQGIMETTSSNPVYYSSIQLEIGNKATDWSAATEDIPEIAASAFTLTDNKISLASKTIELTGETIADAIKAKDLTVGSRTGASALEVLKDGTFYAKGSNGANSSLVIDSDKQLIEITSNRIASGESDFTEGSANVTISGQSGGIRITGETNTKKNSTTIVSNAGIFANTADQSIFAGSATINAKASIVGLGWGNVSKDPYTESSFVAGVYGSSSNDSDAPSYGGYFNVLKANGLCLSVRRATTNTQLDNTDCYISCYNTTSITVDLPPKPYIGQVIYLRQIQSTGFNIRGRNAKGVGYQIHTDGTVSDMVGNRAGRGDTTMLVYDGVYWCLNYMPR